MPLATSSEFRPLFNGKDLTGWKPHLKQPDNWRVKDGILIGSGPEASHLYSERGDYKDFHLRLSARINDRGNSGVYVRELRLVQFGLRRARNILTATSTSPRRRDGEREYRKPISGSNRPVIDVREPPVPASQWFKLDIKAERNRILVMVNDKITADYTDPERRFVEGHIVPRAALSRDAG